MTVRKVLAGLGLLAATTLSANATIVEVHTNYGNFQINLHDEATPETVENFLKYVEDGRYIDTIIHRLVPDFVMQGGGFVFEGKIPLDAIPDYGQVKNEPVYSNVRGTVAMAKIGGFPDSATSQFFVNLEDNSGGSASLDTQSGGFTVFGEVILDGMTVVDAIAQLNRCGDTPMPDVSDEECQNSDYVPGNENFVMIENVTIVDSSKNTADSLDPVPNTSLDDQPVVPDPQPTPDPDSGGSSGGSLGWMSLLALASLRFRRK